MRILPAALAVIFALNAAIAWAADPLRLEVTGVEEEPGRIIISVGAYGPDGKPIPGLTAASFRAALNDAQVAVSGAQEGGTPRAPASVLLLVDASGSMQGEPMTQAKAALQEFVKGLDQPDQAAILAFDTKLTPFQEFTADRTALAGSIGRLTAQGDTALYDAVIEAVHRIGNAPTGRRLIVLLSDGEATSGLDKRDASLASAKEAGVPVVVVGLGSAIDRRYLTELAELSGGRVLEAPTPAALLQAYNGLAADLRSQYNLTVTVPPAIDRSTAATLALRLSHQGQTAEVQRQLSPLIGAAPAFTVAIEGLRPNERLEGTRTVSPSLPSGVRLARAEYSIDGKLIATVRQAPFAYQLEAGALAEGQHLLKVVAVDDQGRRAETQSGFASVLSPPQRSGSFNPGMILVYIGGIATLAGAVLFLIMRQRESMASNVFDRVQPWATRPLTQAAEPMPLLEPWPEPAAPPEPVPVEEPAGRVVLMDEEAIRSGNLDSIREFPIGATPLTLGIGSGCDIQVEDPEGRIAAEEARIWVQKGRLVYHKLTTLSAMATEGVTSGWEILENDEDIAIGPFRLLYRANQPEVMMAAETTVEEETPILPPEDTSYFRNLWSRMPEDPPFRPISE